VKARREEATSKEDRGGAWAIRFIKDATAKCTKLRGGVYTDMRQSGDNVAMIPGTRLASRDKFKPIYTIIDIYLTFCGRCPPLE